MSPEPGVQLCWTRFAQAPDQRNPRKTVVALGIVIAVVVVVAAGKCTQTSGRSNNH